MKHTLLLIAISAVVFTSCSTAYKAAQTPDDVYYSPAKEVSTYARTEDRRDRYQENLTYEDDRFLRMKVQNRDRWQMIDDYSYWYDSRFDYRYDYNIYNNNYYNKNLYSLNNWNSPYGFNPYGYNTYGYNGFNNRNFYGYGGYYSPSYPVIYYKNPKVYSGATGKSNLSTYTNNKYSNSNRNTSGEVPNSRFGNLVKQVFTNPGNNSNSNGSSYERPARTIEPTTTPSNNSGGRSGGYNSTGSSTSTPRPPRN